MPKTATEHKIVSKTSFLFVSDSDNLQYMIISINTGLTVSVLLPW